MLTWIKTYFRSPNIYILKYGEEIKTIEIYLQKIKK